MDKVKIERASRELLKDILDKYGEKHSDEQLLQLIEPAYAAEILGISITEAEYLGPFGGGQDRYEVAGSIDRQKKQISISTKFPEESQRFTAAHELGHWVLHPNQPVMHRDRSIKGLNKDMFKRPPQELEADYFGACFLMPRNLVKREFIKRFRNTPFQFDENNSFEFCREDPQSLVYSDPKTLEREMALATSKHYKMGGFQSLAELFKVSGISMAIRLSELSLVRYP